VDTLKCILQIARGVQELHNHRITHRDLKPENILLTRKYRKGSPFPDIKVADFGLSTKNLIMQTVAGTKEYIAPEQAKFHTYTNSVDVWSIGIIFDELLHGEPYYTGENNKEVFNKILKEDYRVRDPTISDPIKTLLISILKKKPYERPIIAVLKTKIEDILVSME
jgi:serine/threonine protein kinase